MEYQIKEGWQLNPNQKVVDAISKAIERNQGECPCTNPGPTREARLCPCEEYRLHDHCCCGLYVQTEKPAYTHFVSNEEFEKYTALALNMRFTVFLGVLSHRMGLDNKAVAKTAREIMEDAGIKQG